MSKPTATGNLETTPLSQLLVYALDKQLTGSFVFQGSDRKKSALYFLNGAPANAKTGQPVIHLGRLLLELGKIDEDIYNKTLTRVAKERALHGKLLVEARALDQETLDAALSEQLQRQVLWMFSLGPQTAYGFYADQNFLERWGGGPVQLEPLKLIWRGIRRYENLKRIDAAVGKLGSRVLRLHSHAQLARFQFSDAERPVLDVLRAKPQPLDELVASGVGDPSDVKRMVYTLMITRHLDLGVPPLGVGSGAAGMPPPARPAARQAAAPPAPPAGRRMPAPVEVSVSDEPSIPSFPLGSSPSSAGPPSSRGAPHSVRGSEPAPLAEFRRELNVRLEAAPSQNYYEMLGVPVKSASAEISAAFYQLAKKWHPDRLSPDFAPVREEAMKLFSKMTEAHQTLTDEQRRRDYDELVRDGGGTEVEQEEVNKIMGAVLAYQKATVYYRKGNLAEAETLARQAKDDDPAQAEYLALWVQCVSQRPERAAKGDWHELITMMDDAVKREPENERVRMARGELLKRAGQLELAVKDFHWVARRNPNNLDATREVRLFTMRGGDAPSNKRSIAPGKGKEEKGGLLGKFFKR